MVDKKVAAEIVHERKSPQEWTTGIFVSNYDYVSGDEGLLLTQYNITRA